MKTVQKVCLLSLMLTGMLAPAQLWAQVNISGKTGLLYIPSADLQKDGTFTAGYNFNPMNYAIKFNRRNSESIYFVNLVVLPRFEVNVNLLRPDGSIPFKQGGIGDRQLDLKYVALTEKAKRPSVAIIMSAPFGVDNSLLTYALVGTKHIAVTKTIDAAVTVGMGSPYYIGRKTNQNDILSDFVIKDKRDSTYRYLAGPFGGVKLSFAKKAGIMAEWDSYHLNIGAYATLFKHWTLQAGLLNGDQWMFGTSYSVQLLQLPKRLRKHEN